MSHALTSQKHPDRQRFTIETYTDYSNLELNKAIINKQTHCFYSQNDEFLERQLKSGFCWTIPDFWISLSDFVIRKVTQKENMLLVFLQKYML